MPLIMTPVSLTLCPATLPCSCISCFDMMTSHFFHILPATESLLDHSSTLLLPDQISPRQFRSLACLCMFPLSYTMLHCFEFRDISTSKENAGGEEEGTDEEC